MIKIKHEIDGKINLYSYCTVILKSMKLSKKKK